MNTTIDYSNYCYEDLYYALHEAEQFCNYYEFTKDAEGYARWEAIWTEIFNEIERREDLYR